MSNIYLFPGSIFIQKQKGTLLLGLSRSEDNCGHHAVSSLTLTPASSVSDSELIKIAKNATTVTDTDSKATAEDDNDLLVKVHGADKINASDESGKLDDGADCDVTAVDNVAASKVVFDKADPDLADYIFVDDASLVSDDAVVASKGVFDTADPNLVDNAINNMDNDSVADKDSLDIQLPPPVFVTDAPSTPDDDENAEQSSDEVNAYITPAADDTDQAVTETKSHASIPNNDDFLDTIAAKDYSSSLLDNNGTIDVDSRASPPSIQRMHVYYDEAIDAGKCFYLTSNF